MLAKLSRPKVHRALARERLFQSMDVSRERPLTWIVAPPGSGKTTLVASYIEERKLRSAWYHVDPGDDDPGTFFYYLAQAAPPTRRKREPPLPLLTPDYLADLPGFYRHFFRAFFTRLTAPALLVLDNYHELPASSSMHAALEHAVAEVPPDINVVVISRSEPPRNLVRLKSSERLNVIDWPQLRMTIAETRAIAMERAGGDSRVAERVFKLSDGWAAGIALALQRITQHRDRAEPVEREAQAEMFEYFAAQVLSSAPADVQRFLERTALLPTLTASMANRISEREDGEVLLEDLFRRGLFIDRRNLRPPVYHYHDLFREFLLAELERSVSADEYVRLQRFAAQLLEDEGQQDPAIRLYLQAADWAGAKRLMLAAAPGLVAQGRGVALRDWIGALPTDLAQDPWVSFWSGVAITRAAPTQARPSFEHAFREFAAQGVVRAQRTVCTEIMLGYMHEFANLAPLDEWLMQLQRLVAQDPSFPSAAAELQVRTAELFALSFRQPRPDELSVCVARVQELLAADAPPDIAALAAGSLLMHLYVMADLNACARVAARIRALHEDSGLSPVTRALGYLQLGHAALRSGDAPGAEELLNHALDTGAEHAIGLSTVYVYSHLGLAFCALARGDATKADMHRKKLEQYWMPSRKIDGAANLRLQFWIACHRRQWDTALELARRHQAAAHDSGVFMLSFESNILLAIVCAQTRRDAECAAALQPIRDKLAGTAYAHFAYEVDLVEAYRALLSGDSVTCHTKLRSGLDQSKADQGLFLLRMQPQILSRLAAEALAADIETGYVIETVRRLRLLPPPVVPARWPWPLKILTLGQFEVQRDGQPLEFSRKTPKKTLALLKAIIAFGGRNVREQLLLDTFWSDEEGDVAVRSLTAALHRLRSLLGDNDAIQQLGGKLSLDITRVWVDAWAFEKLTSDSSPCDAEQLLGLYRGGFLAEDEGEPWPVTMRERLRGKFIHALGEVARRIELEGRYEQAVECYLRGLDADPAIEGFYQGLMRCYARLDRKSEAIAAYQRLKKMLSILLALKPSASTEKLYASLRQ